MSVVKLLSRIVAPIDEVDDDNVASSMHDHTYGITSDPLTQFAWYVTSEQKWCRSPTIFSHDYAFCDSVLSALIHDADHPGVPNAQVRLFVVDSEVCFVRSLPTHNDVSHLVSASI